VACVQPLITAIIAIVTIIIDGMRVPANPKNVIISSDGNSVTIFSIVDDQFVEKFEIWKKDIQPSLAKREFVVTKNSNGFSLVDEIPNGDHNSGANWIDNNVVPGHSYIYRVYSVDIFGNKSESPFEGKVVVPELSPDVDKSLTTPSILAEVDAKTLKVVVTMICNDPNVKDLQLERRDLTINQENFVSPNNSSRIIMGSARFKHSSYLIGERVQDQDNVGMWNGWINNVQGGVKFIDRLTSFDRTYQYRVHGIDRAGHKTSYGYSDPVLVFRKPMINSPVNFSASFETGSDGSIHGVNISWQSSSLDTSSEQIIGSQNALVDTSVRMLYQLQRQKVGDRWLNFNMIAETSYFDPVVGFSGAIAPEFRPPFLEVNTQYNYRLQAVLSGGFISNTVSQISVFVGNVVGTPQNFVLRTPDPRVRPFYVMLNWDTSTASGIVDHWDIERCEVNNFAAARINSKNPDEFGNLNFKPFRTVYSESSRFRSFWGDILFKDYTSQIFTGQHCFMDSRIVFGNSYFYKITAVDSRGNRSSPAYRGIKITYPSYEKMSSQVFSSDDIVQLTNNLVPVRMAFGIFSEPPLDSMSLNPKFSTASTMPDLNSTTTTRFYTI
jgi:hypothetical protein